MSAAPLVTVITPAYNRADFLPETIDSVLAQGYPNLEYIVLDDGSSDDTLRVLDRYRGRVTAVSHANMGEQRTVNKGFGMASGEYVCVVNSDDPILPGLLAAGVDALESDRDALVAYPDWREIGPQSEPLMAYGLPEYDIGRMLLEFNVSMGPGVLIRRRTFETVGVRDVGRRFTGDLEYWFRVALHGRMRHIPEILATHRTHPGAAQIAVPQRDIARELVSIIELCLASPLLPEALRAQSRRILANACEATLKQCGADAAVWRLVWDRLARSQPLFLLGLYTRQSARMLRNRLLPSTARG